MNLKNVFLLVLALLTGFNKASAQEILTLENAVKIALERNYDIKIQANNVEIAENNVNRGNAGMLPVINGTVTNNNSVQSGTTNFFDANRAPQVRTGAKSNNLAYGAALSWTVFDGFSMFARFNQLRELERLGESNLQLVILSKIADVTNNYYNLVFQQQQLKALQTAIEISRFRVRTAQNRFVIGKAARLEVLNAQVDLNTDTTNYLRQQESYRNTQILLNEVLARDPSISFLVQDSITINQQLTLAELTDRALKLNPSLQAAIISQRIAELNLNIVKGARLPRIGVNTGYNFANSQNGFGLVQSQNNRGFNYGVTASLNIFNGFLQRRNEQNAIINIRNTELDLERIKQSLHTQLATSYQTYLTNLALIKLEESNQKIAKQNMDITLEKFRLGSITTVEVRDAQLNYINASVRLNNALYQAKLGEVGLKEIAGSLTLN
ncbi:TolC family protein [Adhaeribacter aquaticus]|uniref:TolC family protein n=1 Tax=Adhaeribacter aquaticus TaxID=299567 RepID=UPI000406A6E5|nr:TolC family protein [Adhaeribacter aquaticus]